MASNLPLGGFPEKVLAAVGFLPFSAISKTASKWRHIKVVNTSLLCVAVMFVIGAAFRGSVDIMKLVANAMSEPASEHKSPVLRALSDCGYVVFHIQPVIVLSVFLMKRKSWYNVQNCFRVTAGSSGTWAKKMVVWRRTATTLSCITLLVTVYWEYIEWRAYYDENPILYSPDFQGAFAPLPVKVTATQSWISWIALCTLPHFFALQVYVSAIVNAVILRDYCDECFVRIIKIRTQFFKFPKGKITVAVKEMREFHWKLIHCIDELNGVYGWILLIVFQCNLGMACSFLTSILFAPSTVMMGHIRDYSSVVIFFSYTVVFAIPLVQVFEKADRFALELNRLAFEMEMHSTKGSSSKTVGFDGCWKMNGWEQSSIEVVRDLESISRDYVLCFTGGGIVYYSRGLLTAACTFLVTAGFVVQEIVSSNPQNRTADFPHDLDEYHPCRSYNTSRST